MAKRRANPSGELAQIQEARSLIAAIRLRGEDQRIIDAAVLLCDKIEQQINDGDAIASAVLSDDTEKVWYLHAQDDDNYEHVFEDGARMLLLGESSEDGDDSGNCLLLYRPDGRDVWADFETDDEETEEEEST